MDMRSENAEYVDINKDGVACLERLSSMTRVAAGAFGFFTLIQVFEGPKR